MCWVGILCVFMCVCVCVCVATDQSVGDKISQGRTGDAINALQIVWSVGVVSTGTDQLLSESKLVNMVLDAVQCPPWLYL